MITIHDPGRLLEQSDKAAEVARMAFDAGDVVTGIAAITLAAQLVQFLPRPKAVVLTWMCQKCGWMNDNNNGPCRKCGAPQAKADSDSSPIHADRARMKVDPLVIIGVLFAIGYGGPIRIDLLGLK
jgi:hypothetical protein